MPAAGDVDVVIVNYRGSIDTLAAIALLAPWRFNLLWIVDNSADAAEAEALRQGTAHLPWVRLIVAEDNLGFGRACNLAFAQSGAPYFLLLNPDARIAPAAIDHLAAVLREDRRWAAVAPKTYWDAAKKFLLPTAYPQTPAAALGGALLTRLPAVARAAARRYLARMRACMAQDAPFPTSFVNGAILMLRRQAVLAAGGLFDPDYFMFFEDAELSLRLRRAGFRVGVAPHVDAVHEYRHKALKGPLMAASRDTYFRKCFPAFFRASGRLARIDRLAANWTRWSMLPSSPLGNAEEFAQRFPSGVLALSPSPTMMPAIFRPLHAAPLTLDDGLWRLLEPGRYVAATQTEAHGLRFVAFERGAAAA